MRNSCGSALVVSLVVFGLSACGDDLPTTVQASVSRAVPTQPGGTFGGADVGGPADASTGTDAVLADTTTPPDSARVVVAADAPDVALLITILFVIGSYVVLKAVEIPDTTI